MSSSDWLAGVGILVSIALAILTAFAAGPTLSIVLTAALLLLVIALAWYLYWRLHLPAYTVAELKMEFQIHDRAGNESTARKTVVLRPNYPNLKEYVHKNFSSDGTATLVPDRRVNIVRSESAAGQHGVTVAFDTPLKAFSRVATWLEWKLQGAFTGNPEAVVLTADQPIRAAVVEVTLPPDRPPQRAVVIRSYAGRQEELAPPRVDASRITWACSRRWRGIPMGDYEIRWWW